MPNVCQNFAIAAPAKALIEDEAPRIASNIAKLPHGLLTLRSRHAVNLLDLRRISYADAQARPHCEIGRVCFADRLNPHVDVAATSLPVGTDLFCLLLCPLPGPLVGVRC